jgi:hypothetical protein
MDDLIFSCVLIFARTSVRHDLVFGDRVSFVCSRPTVIDGSQKGRDYDEILAARARGQHEDHEAQSRHR